MTITEDGPGLLALDAGEQYRFSFAMASCIGCHSCEVACAEQNGLPVGTAWRRVGEIEGGSFPDTRRFNLSMACNHCLDPTCLSGCPTEAYVKLGIGVVQHQAEECIGCQYCTWNCPYSVPVFQPNRKIVTKCDMCLPRLEAGQKPACVDACPTHAIGVEKVDVETWRADHHEGDAPNLPSADISLSTTRIILPEGVPLETFAASDHHLEPEDPHWPLVAVTLLTQFAVGVSAATLALAWLGRLGVVATTTSTSASTSAVIAFLAGAVALAASLLHLGRPERAWKALRNLRRSWLSREVLLFSAYAGCSALDAVVTLLSGSHAGAGRLAVGTVTVLVGAAGIYASGRLYVVPGRPAWQSPLTIAAFYLSAVSFGPLLLLAVLGRNGVDGAWAGFRVVAAAGIIGQLVVFAANLVRLQRDGRREARGAVRLNLERFRPILIVRVVAGLAGAVLALIWEPAAALVLVVLAEAIARYLFYVTVVPLDMPGSFFRRGR
jgi:DMSO reductase iron-sulfur subunit